MMPNAETRHSAHEGGVACHASPPGVLSPGGALAYGPGLKVWERPGRGGTIEGSMAHWLDALKPDQFPDGRLLLRPDQVREGVLSLFSDPVPVREQGGRAFLDDIAHLTARFAEMMSLDHVDLRLDHVRDDACWKFHCDRVALRLICTYRGPGTEYVPECHREQALARQRFYYGPLRRLSRFSVALFQGTLSGDTQEQSPKDSGSMHMNPDQNSPGQEGVVHRSPPIAGTGVSRLVLCLNAPSSVSPPPWPGAA